MKKNIIGEIFGGVKVISDSGKRNSSGDILWLCECLICGKQETLARKYDLNRGDYQSCGCIKRKLISNKKTIHGHSYSEEYGIWSGIKDRCYNNLLDEFPRYGGRGISVCDRWLNSFENFLEDMGERPGKEYSIDRIDNNGNYCPENCRWATKSEQAYNRNKISDTSSKYKNIYFHKASNKWITRLWINRQRVYLGSFDTEEEALQRIKEYESKV